jgi:hypothetical protein
LPDDGRLATFDLDALIARAEQQIQGIRRATPERRPLGACRGCLGSRRRQLLLARRGVAGEDSDPDPGGCALRWVSSCSGLLLGIRRGTRLAGRVRDACEFIDLLDGVGR